MSRGGIRLVNFFDCFLSSSTPPSIPEESPPNEFLCPISGLVMEDPVIIPTGHTLDRSCIEACRDLNYTPPIILSSSSSSSSTVDLSSLSLVPNLFAKDSIFKWRNRVGHIINPSPFPISEEDARSIVERLMMEGSSRGDVGRRGAGNQESSSNASRTSAADALEERKWQDLMNPEISSQLAALNEVLSAWATMREGQVSVCITEKIMAAVISKLWSDHNLIQTNASTAIMMLSENQDCQLRSSSFFTPRHHQRRQHDIMRLCCQGHRQSGQRGRQHDDCRHMQCVYSGVWQGQINTSRKDLIDAGAADLMLELVRKGDGMERYGLGVLHQICTGSPARFRTVASTAGAYIPSANNSAQGVMGRR